MRQDYKHWVSSVLRSYEAKRALTESNYQDTGIQRYRNEADKAEYFIQALLAAQRELEDRDAAEESFARRMDGLYRQAKNHADTLPGNEAVAAILSEIKRFYFMR